MAQQLQPGIPFTTANLQALTNTIAAGATRVDYPNGGGVTYASLESMLQLRDRMLRELASAGDSVPPRNTRGSVFVRR